ncbi:MAG: hypothetical protein B5M54_03765 [Candidatus Aminicenantes bacterium 4484_214]|nr:MAG: hypothetical protein B5M54_03765 [Candidatus Aminicenantes bacterium 4484_214]
MKALFAFGLLILVAFLGSRFLVRRKKISSVVFIFHTGLIYLLLGLALGEKGLKVIDSAVLNQLSPLLFLGLGWVGFVFGFQLEKRYLVRFQRRLISFSFLYFLIFLVAIGFLSYFCLKPLLGLGPNQSLLFSLAVALLFSLTSPTILDVILYQTEGKELPSYLARFLVSVTSFWGMIGLGLFVFISFSSTRQVSLILWPRAMIVMLGTGIPILLAYFFHHLTKRKFDEEELLLFLLALVFLCAGVAESLNIPPLYPPMILGIVYSNLTRKQERLYPLLLNSEKPMFVVLFILVGALWQPFLSWKLVVVICLLILSKILILTGVVSRLVPFLRLSIPFFPGFGLCFLSSGVMGITFTVCVYLWWGRPSSQVFMNVGLLSVLSLDFISPWLIRWAIFKRKKEA